MNERSHAPDFLFIVCISAIILYRRPTNIMSLRDYWSRLRPLLQLWHYLHLLIWTYSKLQILNVKSTCARKAMFTLFIRSVLLTNGMNRVDCTFIRITLYSHSLSSFICTMLTVGIKGFALSIQIQKRQRTTYKIYSDTVSVHNELVHFPLELRVKCIISNVKFQHLMFGVC